MIFADHVRHALQLDISGGTNGPVTLFAAVSGPGSLGAFSSFVDSALGKTLDPPFTPYDNNLDFLIAAYTLEDVMVTAYEVCHAAKQRIRKHRQQM